MLIEQKLEEIFVSQLSAMSALADAEIIASRSPAAAGYVKGEADTAAKQIVAVGFGLRQHDDFTLPTVNIEGSVSVSTRAEMCPTGVEHEEALEAIAEKLTAWHYDGGAFSSVFSISGRFFAAELRMDGGTGKTYDAQRAAWTESVSFTVRGTILDINSNPNS